MVAIGFALLGWVMLAVFFWWRGWLFRTDWWPTRILLLGGVFSVLGPQIANQAGWFTAEMGRQPWIVHELLKTSQALSEVVTAQHILASLIMFTLIYLLLFILFIFLLTRKIQHGPDDAEQLNEMPASWKAVLRDSKLEGRA
jgi:cytochrome d ubiquinol oxidase subunit I